MNEQQIIELLQKYEAGELSQEEKARLETWYIAEGSKSTSELSAEQVKVTMDRLRSELPVRYSVDSEAEDTEIYNNSAAELNTSAALESEVLVVEAMDSGILVSPNKSRMLWRKIAIAASMVLALSAGLRYLNRDGGAEKTYSLYTNDVAPGSNQATLTLADGNIINLSDAQNGIIIGNNDIKYTDGSSLDARLSSPFVIQSDSEGSLSTMLSLSTPKAGQYQITLPDGTKVWLNAASTLKYPSRFSGKERRVELEGEAYFEVAKNTKQPFIAISEGQEVMVLGTHFNINAYSDEEDTKTTLIEGSVQVSALSAPNLSSRGTKDLYNPSLTTTLTPGQQSIVTGTNIKTTTVDPETIIDWKQGDFIFTGEDFQSIMRKIARWYDIEIIYDPTLPKGIEIGGWISRGNPLSEVLKMIESTGKVHFKIEGRRVTVLK